jgi:hypothetical protein
MFHGLPADLVQLMASTNVSMHNHGGGVSPDAFQTDPQLSALFDLTSTALDRNGQPMANVIEGKLGLPIYGLIWHPEMPSFEDFSPVIPHHQAAVRTSQWVSNFFVEETRTHSFNRRFPTDEAEQKALIWHDAPTLTDSLGNGSEVTEVYIWQKAPAQKGGR